MDGDLYQARTCGGNRYGRVRVFKPRLRAPSSIKNDEHGSGEAKERGMLGDWSSDPTTAGRRVQQRSAGRMR